MWFINFVLAAATCISLFVYGWVLYLERPAATQAPASATIATVPLPRPRPQIVGAQAVVVETEIVREPKPDESLTKGRRKQRQQPSGRATW
ncbi:MAG: hypothetical protein QOI12_1806 [Alphaproteobacteria bacterium]|jgi:hypothetical protein|nr:hypothetical protein [Alphaproteobacteria bacterium]